MLYVILMCIGLRGAPHPDACELLPDGPFISLAYCEQDRAQLIANRWFKPQYQASYECRPVTPPVGPAPRGEGWSAEPEGLYIPGQQPPSGRLIQRSGQ